MNTLADGLADRFSAGLMELSAWPLRRWLVAGLVAMVAAVASGIPTGIIVTPIYHRMTPVTWWDYPIWASSAAFFGLLAATYVRAGPPTPQGLEGRALGGSVLSVFAVGCPICNKLVVALIGVSGALNVFAPLQPILGLLALTLLAVTLSLRLRMATACPLPASS